MAKRGRQTMVERERDIKNKGITKWQQTTTRCEKETVRIEKRRRRRVKDRER